MRHLHRRVSAEAQAYMTCCQHSGDQRRHLRRHQSLIGCRLAALGGHREAWPSSKRLTGLFRLGWHWHILNIGAGNWASATSTLISAPAAASCCRGGGRGRRRLSVEAAGGLKDCIGRGRSRPRRTELRPAWAAHPRSACCGAPAGAGRRPWYPPPAHCRARAEPPPPRRRCRGDVHPRDARGGLGRTQQRQPVHRAAASAIVMPKRQPSRRRIVRAAAQPTTKFSRNSTETEYPMDFGLYPLRSTPRMYAGAGRTDDGRRGMEQPGRRKLGTTAAS